MFVPDVEKFPPGAAVTSRIQEWDGRTCKHMCEWTDNPKTCSENFEGMH